MTSRSGGRFLAVRACLESPFIETVWWGLRVCCLAAVVGCQQRTATAHGSTSLPIQTTDLTIRFIDVGQGDAALLTAGGQAVLVDAGRGDGIVLALHEYGVDSLTAAIASHNHEDHIGGMDAVVADFPIARYIFNGRAATNRNASDVQSWLTRRGVARQLPPWGPLRIGNATITVHSSSLAGTSDENNASLAVLVEQGSFRALLTGDSEAEELSGWIAEGFAPRVTVLKAAHHGARNGVTPGWLQRTDPQVVVISVGANNPYGHPDLWALRYYGTHGRKVYRTDLNGTTTVVVDHRGNYRIETTAGATR